MILWGSSYSGALVLREAAARPDGVTAVLAFSPASAGPMEGCRPEGVVDRLPVPVMVLRPADEARIPAVRSQLHLFLAAGHRTWAADPGAHGSSMLNPARVDGPVEHTWRAVREFLSGIER